MTSCISHVTLLGRLGKRGVEVRHANGGTPCAVFTIELVETTASGSEFTTYIECEAWGKRAEAASAITPGAVVVFEGKLKRQKQSERWTTGVSGYELVPFHLANP